MNRTQLYEHPSWKEKGMVVLKEISYQDFVALAEQLQDDQPMTAVEHLRVRQEDRTILQSWTNIFGTGFFPYHTDFVNRLPPPHILLLRLAEESKSNRNTLFIDTQLLPFSYEDYQQLTNEKWKVPSKNKTKLIRIVEQPSFAQGETIFRFDPVMMKPFSKKNKGNHILAQAISKVTPYSHTWKAQDVLLVNNWRIIHARDTSAQPDPDRVLQRITII
jgi:hypothetical protein